MSNADQGDTAGAGPTVEPQEGSSACCWTAMGPPPAAASTSPRSPTTPPWSPSTVRRWISRRHPQSRRVAIPKRRIVQLQRGPAEVERRNEQQYQYALNALASIDDERSILPAWREQGWLDQHTVAILAIHGKPWLQVAVTNASARALGELRRRGVTVASLTVPTRFHAQVLAHAVMVRQRGLAGPPRTAPTLPLAALRSGWQTRHRLTSPLLQLTWDLRVQPAMRLAVRLSWWHYCSGAWRGAASRARLHRR